MIRASTFLQSCGIIQQKTCAYTPEQNGIVECKHRHIVELSLLTFTTQSSLPFNCLPFAFATVVYLINRIPSPSLQNKYSYEILLAFGCACYPLLKPYTSHKLQPKTTRCVFLGYPKDTKGYLCFNMSNGHLYTTRHVLFDEFIFPFSSSNVSSLMSPLHLYLINHLILYFYPHFLLLYHNLMHLLYCLLTIFSLMIHLLLLLFLASDILPSDMSTNPPVSTASASIDTTSQHGTNCAPAASCILPLVIAAAENGVTTVPLVTNCHPIQT